MNSCTIAKTSDKSEDTKDRRDDMAKVLVVDDAAFMCLTIKQMLERNGHTMIGQASTGVEAIKQFTELKPELILMDITMPEMNGVEALERIKAIDPKAKIIICSALAQKEMIAKSIELGVEDFIVKPFKEERLIQAIDKVMR